MPTTKSDSSADALAEVRALRDVPLQEIELTTKGLFANEVLYTIDQDNASGNENHFQGVSVLSDGEHYIVAGSNWESGQGDVFTFRVDAAERRGVCIAQHALDFPLWHAGGCDAWDDIVAVPAEFPAFGPNDPGRFPGRAEPPVNPGQPRSSIFFLQGPNLTVLPARIDRAGVLATSVGFTRLEDERFAVIALAQPKPPGLRVDCYISRTTNIEDGFDSTPVWTRNVTDGSIANVQSMSLMRDDDGLLLVAFAGAKKGEVIAYRFAPDLPNQWETVERFNINVEPADLAAGANLNHIDGALTLTAVSRYRALKSKKLTLVQARPGGPVMAERPAQAAPPARAGAVAGRQRKARRGVTAKLDATRDTIDFRDLMYIPTLIEVPSSRPLALYTRHGIPILDQGQEGACTGFGLATVIHYLTYHRDYTPKNGKRAKRKKSDKCVSPWMLYKMARRYDEWPGENYSGSSARGAMKAWQKHGVCSDEFWKFDSRNMDVAGWLDARERPLGAYFRVNHKDIIAMHAAIAEVGILYATGMVHEGWDNVAEDGLIAYEPGVKELGGHAFAIVAYDREGFWIQNSWGPDWGNQGFARITYDDWLASGTDVWVARMGAPVLLTGQQSTAAGIQVSAKGSRAYVFSELRPHIISTGNDGALRTGGMYGTDEHDVERIIAEEFPETTQNWQTARLLLYAHGGLVSEEGAVQRVADYAQPFLAKEIYPLAFIWKTDFWSTLTNILRDSMRKRKPEGFLDASKDFMLDRLDDALEPLARVAGGKAQWDEMKENAELASLSPRGGGRVAAELVTSTLARLTSEGRKTELHIAAHSAGSIYFAHMIEHLASERVIDSVALWAPAITIALFKRTYLPAIEQGRIRRFTLYTMSDQVERDDHCANVYHKSLLYLVSNAFEQTARIPIIRDTGVPLLGLERCVRDDTQLKALLDQKQHYWFRAPGPESAAAAHGAFDDDTKTVYSTTELILGKKVGGVTVTFPRSSAAQKDRREEIMQL